MKTTKRKTRTAAKRKSTNLHEARKTKPKLAGRGRGPEGPTGRFWTQWIEPKGAALLAERLMPCHFLVKNCGSGNITLFAEHGDYFDLRPGEARATYVHGTLRLENRTDQRVLIVFEFFPVHVIK